MFRPRHYHDWRETGPRGVVQVDSDLETETRRRAGRRFTLPESILRLAQAEYERQHHGQDYERIQDRGGLSVLEVVRLLADYVERLGGEPTAPRETQL